ncbi:glycosyltransferase family 2 protein [Rubinisphaera sp. JC750]|uniref:glycosyltransferase family 2 protein n=1 Tax=Rubinisphaera sp. JC750 TaxID=2898658 RepID=UPI001F3F90BA|nr:glycosyltransferase family 2 protein [Rubinisphaera sp. JC750]
MLILAVLCWMSVGLIVYSYFLYPVMLAVVSRVKRKATEVTLPEEEPSWPTVSLVIAAYREESVIAERLQNALAMDYPADKLEILIGVDGDLDGTGRIVSEIQDPRVRLLQYPERRGKASVLNDSIPQASGEIVLLSDANTFWDVNAVKQLVRHFADEQVGGVCGRLILTDAETGKNVDGYYWRYENWIKNKEGEIGALLGANGAIYALRKSLYEPIPPHTIVDDFLIGMRVHRARKRFLYDKTAIAREETAPSIDDEFRRRTRIGAGNFQSLCWLGRLLLPDFGVVSWAFWSHKVLRWVCPLLMVLALISSAILADQPVFRGLLVAQGVFYALAIVGHVLPLPGKLASIGRLAWMFVMMNVALGVGFFRWVFRTQKATWKRTERSAGGSAGGPFACSAAAK